MRLVLLLLFMILSINLKGQSRQKKIVVQIDTLDFIDKYEDFFDFKLFVTNQGFANIGDEFDSGYYEFNKYPQYIGTIIVESDSSCLRIPFDNIQGYTEFFGLYNSTIDTLKIDRYRLYSNCNFDTVKVETIYLLNDTLIDKKKSNFKSVVAQFDCKSRPPDTLKLVVNGKLYSSEVLFSQEVSGIVSNGHGYRRTIFGKEKNRFYFTEVHSYGINSVKFELKY